MKINLQKSFDNHQLELAWNTIVESYGYLAQNSFDWCKIWWKYFKNNKRNLYIVTVEEDNEIIGIAPMFLERRKIFTVLKFLGSPQTDFHELLITKGEKYEKILDCIVDFFNTFKEWDIVLFEHINSEGSEYDFLDKKLEKKFIIECPVVEFGGLDWDTYISHIQSRNLKKEFKRRSRALERDFRLEFKYVTLENEFAEYFDDIVRLHIYRWDTENEDSKLKSEHRIMFIREVFCSLLRKEKAAMWILFGNGEMLAYLLGFLQGGTFYGWNTSFNPDHGYYCPGKVIFGYVIKDLIKQGYKQFNFMRGGYFYKKGWMPRDSEHVSENYLFVMAKSNLMGRFLRDYYLEWRGSIKIIFGGLLRKRLVRRVFRLDN